MRSTLLLSALTITLVATSCGGATGGGGAARESDGGLSDAVAALEAGDLEDFGCGYAFSVGTADATVRLSLWSDTGLGGPPQGGTSDLGEGWTGELVVGRDLFAQWCDDVVEPDEPEVVEERSWEVAGTLTWELEEGDGQCPSVATAVLTDAEVIEDGESQSLRDVEFRNEFFGCFAG